MQLTNDLHLFTVCFFFKLIPLITTRYDLMIRVDSFDYFNVRSIIRYHTSPAHAGIANDKDNKNTRYKTLP